VNPLDDYPQARKVLYLIQWITTGITGAAAIYFATQPEVPGWFTVTVAILAFVWTYTGITAQQNVPTRGGDNGMFGNPLERRPQDENGVYRYDSAGGVIILVLAIVGIVLLVLLLAGGVKF